MIKEVMGGLGLWLRITIKRSGETIYDRVFPCVRKAKEGIEKCGALILPRVLENTFSGQRTLAIS
jgi:hypothetical protein